MTPTNVVSMDFETKEAMEDFVENYLGYTQSRIGSAVH